MLFKNIIGQQEAKQRLINEAKQGKIPHARIFCGPKGAGKWKMAYAYAALLLCKTPKEDDACGTCPQCRLMERMTHPDVLFVVPATNNDDADALENTGAKRWRDFCLNNPHFDLNDWNNAIGAQNQQTAIGVRQWEKLTKRLAMKTALAERRVVIVWMPERMNAECANKMLKWLEEPPGQTVFLMVTEDPDALLPTLMSRMQRLDVPPIDGRSLAEHLRQEHGIDGQAAIDIARRSEGNLLRALELIQTDGGEDELLEGFVRLMRLAYQRNIRELKQWSEGMAAKGREGQKRFLTYCQRMVRENFACNFRREGLTALSPQEEDFARRFAPFVNEGNVMGLMEELGEAQRHIEQNVNARMVFFDLALKVIVLLVQKH